MIRCPYCKGVLDRKDICSHCKAKIKTGVAPEHGLDTSPRYSLSYFIGEAFTSVFKPQPIDAQPSRVAHGRKPSGYPLLHLIAAFVILGLGMVVLYGNMWLVNIALTIGGFSIPLILLFWFMRSDRSRPRSVELVVYLFVWGAISTILSLHLNRLVVPVLGVAGAAIVEEPLKLFGIYLLTRASAIQSEIDSHLDGLIYGAVVGAGFVSLENIEYLLGAGSGTAFTLMLLNRSTTSFAHIAWTAIGARTIGLANALRGRIKLTDMIPGLIIVIPLHLMWNGFGDILRGWFVLPITILIIFRELNMAVSDEVRWEIGKVVPGEKKI